MKKALALAVAVCTAAGVHGEVVRLESLNLDYLQQGWGTPHPGASVEGHPLSIGGQPFAHGLGTHAQSTFRVALHGQAERFTAAVGVDDEVGQRGSVVFKLRGDGKLLWESGLLRGGEAAKAVTVD